MVGLALATREVRQTEVAGVETLWAPGDGMAFARLQFRVGQADERLPIRGITHLAEHLAFERLGQPTYSHNGSVAMDSTTFEVGGTEDEVGELLREVTQGLHDAPGERIDAERHLLKVESRRRGGVFEELASVRHGARGYGLSAYLELGLEHLQADDLREWARTWFTADNAVLWLWGADPSRLDLALPRGQRMPLPTPDVRPMRPRSWISWGEGGAALTFLARTDRATAYAGSWWLHRHLTKALRHDAGLAYSVDVQHRALGDSRLFAIGVDGLAERKVDLRNALLDVLEGLENVTVPEGELVAWKREMAEYLSSTERSADLGRLDAAATGLLFTGGATSPADFELQVGSVTTDAVRSVVRQWADTCLLAVPEGLDMPDAWNPVKRSSADSVRASQVFIPASRALEGQRLLVSDEGVTAEAGAQVRWTVRWADCAAVLRHADGTLTPIGNDGVSLQLRPGDWVGDKALLPAFMQRIDRELLVPVDTKPTQDVVTGLSGLAGISTSVLGLLVAGCWTCTLLITSLITTPADARGALVGVLVFVALSLGATWALVKRLRAPKERRALPAERTEGIKRLRTWLARQPASRLLAVEVAMWAVVVVLAVLLLIGGHGPLFPFLIGGFAVQVRRERQRILARAKAAG